MNTMLLYMKNILASVNEAAMIAWRFMENLKCQATEFSFSFMVVRNCWGNLRGSYTTTAAWRLCGEWIGEGSETEGREGY